LSNEKDPYSILEDIIDDNGNVMEEYGGYRIEVLNHMAFPWADVFKLLLRLGHEVWVDIEGEKLIIVSKPKTD
jgi:hypothetical protein